MKTATLYLTTQIEPKMNFSSSTQHYNERTTVCREVFRILAERAPPRRAYDVAFLKRQTYILDDFLYKLSSTMEEYCDLNSLEQRMLVATSMILQSPGITAASVLSGFLESS
mmetsp:Transcript_20564/g.42815  ORF Transcript_20564/g.42815 Transcript_20564/m.42815 type:complete len:112 (-) Transcript_20564:561-896(-)